MSNTVNKFKVGDVVEIISLGKTVSRYGGKDFLLPLGSISVVNTVFEDSNELTLEDDLFYDPIDLKLIKSADEINSLLNESIEKSIESKTYNPLVAQEGGGHYKNRGIQPIEYSHANNLSASQHSVVKYITRYYDKGGIEDLSKIVHFVLLEAYFRYGEQGSTELKDKILTILCENKEK